MNWFTPIAPILPAARLVTGDWAKKARRRQKVKEAHARYRARNAEKIKARRKERHLQNSERDRELHKLWRIKNREHAKLIKKMWARKRYAEFKAKGLTARGTPGKTVNPGWFIAKGVRRKDREPTRL